MFIQGKQHTEKRRSSAKDEEFKYQFKPSRVERTNRSSSRMNTKRSTSRQRSVSKNQRSRVDNNKSLQQEEPTPNAAVFDRLSNRGQSNQVSIEALRCSQEKVKQKLLDKYFQPVQRQNQAAMQKSPMVLSRYNSNNSLRSADTARVAPV